MDLMTDCKSWFEKKSVNYDKRQQIKRIYLKHNIQRPPIKQ